MYMYIVALYVHPLRCGGSEKSRFRKRIRPLVSSGCPIEFNNARDDLAQVPNILATLLHSHSLPECLNPTDELILGGWFLTP